MSPTDIPILLAQVRRSHRPATSRALYETLDDLARRQEVEVLSDLYDALENEPGPSGPERPGTSGFRVQADILKRLIVLGGEVGAVAAAILVAGRSEIPSDTLSWRAIHVADLLAEIHPRVAPRLLEHETIDPEFCATLLQTLVLRGAYPTPQMHGFWDRYRGPLRWLPLQLIEWERSLPRTFTHGLGISGVRGGVWPVRVRACHHKEDAPPPARVTAYSFAHPPREEAMLAPFDGFMERSAALFRVEPPDALHDDPRAVMRLPAAPFIDVDVERSSVQRVASGQIGARLFQAAAWGSLLGYGVGMAYGRLRAWEALKGAVGATSAYFEMAVQAVEAAMWLELDVHGPWFIREIYDYCFVAVTEDGEVAVMAGSDTD